MRKERVLVSVLVRLRGSNAHLPRVLVQNHPVAAVAKRAKSIYAAWLPKVMAANKAAAPNRPHLHPPPHRRRQPLQTPVLVLGHLRVRGSSQKLQDTRGSL
jgi:hypothetical protein